MKKATKIISGILSISMLLLHGFVLPCFATGASLDTEMIEQQQSPDYSAHVLYGKIFPSGENEVVSVPTQLDTSITNVKIFNNQDITELVFDYGNKTISMDAYLIEAKTNNVNNDHYVFSPIDFSHSFFEYFSISFTTNANVHDLMEVNYSMQGENVLSILLKDKHSGDVYYWQGVVSPCNESNAFSTNAITENIQANISPTADNYEEISNRTNEQYYLSNCNSDFMLTTEEYYSQISEYETNKAKKEEQLSSYSTTRSTSSNNPFYDIDEVPNSVFQTVTNEWTSGVAWSNPSMNPPTSVNYYAYSYDKYGNGNVYTLIMLLSFQEIEKYNGASDQLTASKRLVLNVTDNETVVYYKNIDSYEFFLGGNDVVEFYPAIEMKSTSDAQGHIMIDRVFGGLGYKNPTVAEIVAKAAEIAVGIISKPLENGKITLTLDVLDFMLATLPQTVVLDATLLQYGTSIESQLLKWGHVIGSTKVTMDGYLCSPQNYFFVECSYTAPTLRTARNNTWVVYYSLGMA